MKANMTIGQAICLPFSLDIPLLFWLYPTKQRRMVWSVVIVLNTIGENVKRVIWAFGVLMLILLVVFFVGVHRRSQAQQALPVWQPNPALMSSLGPEVTMQGYGMRLPNGYEAKYGDLLSNLQTFGVDMYFWHNDRHSPDASGLSFDVIRRINLHTPAETARYELSMKAE